MTVIAERPESAYVKGGIFRKFGVELPKPVAQIFMKNKLNWEEPLSGAMEIDLDVE